MRLPNIGVKGSELNRDLLDSWLQEKNAQFSNVEFTDVKALFMPYATSELCAQMVVQTMKQITNYSRYKRIVMLGLSHSRVTKGIYIPDSNSYRSGLTEFQMQLEPELEQQVLTCGSSTEISKVSQEFIDICDVAYNLPLIAGLTAELMLPIVPITYHRAEKSDLVKLIDLLVDNDSLMILCGGLSHSLSIQESKSLDSESISKVIALDSSIRNVQSNSYIALNSLIKLAEDHYWRPRLISYQSTGSKHNVKNTAGYASIVFFNQSLPANTTGFKMSEQPQTQRQTTFATLDQAFSVGNGQDSALNWLRLKKLPVSVFLISGIKLEGVIAGFDPYCILLNDPSGNQQMVYKAKISTITISNGGSGQGGKRQGRNHNSQIV